MTNVTKTNEKATIIDGDVVLTKDSIDELRICQDEDNTVLNDFCNHLSNTVCFLADRATKEDNDNEKAAMMADLVEIRAFIQKLRKP